VNIPKNYSSDELAELRKEAIKNFRAGRLEEPLEDYIEAFDDYLGVTEELLETSVDLTELEKRALDIVTNKSLLKALRYIAAPPISDDDLKTLAEVKSLAPGSLKKNPVAVREIVRTIMVAIDRKRFTWDFTNGGEPDEHERSAAVLATAALLASAHVATKRRHAQQHGQAEIERHWLYERLQPRLVWPGGKDFETIELVRRRPASFEIQRGEYFRQKANNGWQEPISVETRRLLWMS